jgi:hypothetical protein
VWLFVGKWVVIRTGQLWCGSPRVACSSSITTKQPIVAALYVSASPVVGLAVQLLPGFLLLALLPNHSSTMERVPW